MQMPNDWQQMVYTDAIAVNPRVHLAKGRSYSFLDMASVDTSARCALATELRLFTGGGSRFAPGDTLLARITPCLENGKIARYCGPGKEAHGSTEFIVIRGRDNVTDSGYAYYLTKWEGVCGYAISQMTGTSGRQRVPTESLSNLIVPVPPLPEQRRIAHILGTLDDKIENNRKTAKTLEAIAQAIFKSWFVDFDPVRAKMAGESPESICKRLKLTPEILDLFPDRLVDSELGEIPEGWGVGAIGELFGFQNGYAFKSRDWQDYGVPVIKIGSVKPGLVDISNVSYVSEDVAIQANDFRLQPADLVVGMTGYVGEVGLIPKASTSPLLNQRVGRIVLTGRGTKHVSYAYCLTRQPAFKIAVEAKAHGTAQANVSSGAILSIPTVAPTARAMSMSSLSS